MGAVIEVGDHVRIGRSSLTWEVMAEAHAYDCDWLPSFVLASGQTNRKRIEPVDRLTLHTKKKED